MLTLDGLAFERGGFTLRADWVAKPRARIALIGPSGGGKSTLLALIAGFETPRSGRLTWHGNSLTLLPPGERPVTILFQEGNLFPHLTAFQNVALGLRPNLKLTRDEAQRVRGVLARMGLEDEAKKPSQLSGGQRARVALARAVLRARPILLLDEPFSALGPALRDEMFALVEETSAEATLLLVTHDPDEAARMDEICVVDKGVAQKPAPSAALLSDPGPELSAYLGKR